MSLYCGIDLHSNNHVIVIIDEQDNKLYDKRIDNNLSLTLEVLSPFKSRIKSIAVESTFNWYWLVDGLVDNGFKVQLVNTAAVKQYEGLKFCGDHQDAFHLAHLMRLGILPTGYAYPKKQREIRDLLRRRRQLVRHSSSHLISIQNQIWRSLGYRVSCNEIRKSTFKLPFEDDSCLGASASCNLTIQRELAKEIQRLEERIIGSVESTADYKRLRNITGLGPILSLTILLETGDIKRFKSAGNYASYCRCVTSVRESNGKKKGVGNRKSGNKYLSWAFSEAAHFLIRFETKAKKFYEKKKRKRNGIVAMRAVAHKISRAVFHVLNNQQEFDIDRAFG